MFISVVLVVKNIASTNPGGIEKVLDELEVLNGEYELLIVDNGSQDSTVEEIKSKFKSGEFPNSILFSLSQTAEMDAALWLGVDNSIGDFVITMPGDEANAAVIPLFLSRAQKNLDFSIGINKFRVNGSAPFRFFRWLAGSVSPSTQLGLSRTALLSRHLVTHLRSHSRPHLAFRRLPLTPGLTVDKFNFTEKPLSDVRKTLRRRFESGMQLLFWRNPTYLRISSFLALGGAIMSLAYSFFVLAVFLTGQTVEAGWTSTSLQISGMFFLTSLVLVVMSEALLLNLSVASQDPIAFPAEEFMSKEFGQLSRLNVSNPGEASSAQSLIGPS